MSIPGLPSLQVSVPKVFRQRKPAKGIVAEKGDSRPAGLQPVSAP
ncbi:hypothetical protein IMZ02_29165 [Klebsiella pneumoniae]|nr:hypothetical protein [Klebsiella pneumoniae]